LCPDKTDGQAPAIGAVCGNTVEQKHSQQLEQRQVVAPPPLLPSLNDL
jgi:hypothetical protein